MDISEIDLQIKETLNTSEDVLSYTQRLRQELLSTVTAKGMPTDVKEQYLVATVLSDLDKVALTKLKIGSKEKQNSADREANLIAAKLFSKFGNINPFQGKELSNSADEVSLDDSKLEPLKVIDGETDVGISTIDYKEFMSKMEEDSPKVD